jgi:Protein of unknown function (DUF1570)
MRWIFLCLLGVLSGLAWGLESPAQTAAWYQQRAALRKSRVAMEQGASDDRVARAVRASRLIEELVAKAKEQGIGRDDEDLINLVSGVSLLDPNKNAPLTALLATLPEKTTADAKQLKIWQPLLETKRNDLLKPTEKLFKDALEAGVPSVARDCVDQALALWPDHRNLRRNLGQIKFENRWYGPRGAELTKLGQAWDEQLGWILVKDRARYAKGEYYDFQSKQWTTLDAANAIRSDLKNQWVIQTEHLVIQGTAPLKALVDVANRIETFYDRVFAAYSGFFLKVSGKKVSDEDFKVLFGTMRKDKANDKAKSKDRDLLVVNVAKDKSAYVASLPAGVDAGWSAGMFIPNTRESYFYQGIAEVIYHEFTHQILHIFSGTNRAPAWLTEGAAVYTESPVFEAGRMVLGEMDGNEHLSAFFHQMKSGKALTLAQILALEDGRVWMSSTTPDLNYPAAGMLVEFCMEADNRRHRSDFLDFLRDSYLGTTSNYKVWDYLGMSYAAFDTAFSEWIDGQAKRSASAVPPSETPKR